MRVDFKLIEGRDDAMDRMWLVVFLWSLGREAVATTPDCERALVPESRPWVEEQLGHADAQIGAADWDGADLTLDGASRFPRSADVSISERCLGEALAGRLFTTRQRLALGRARDAEAAGARREATTYYVLAGELGEVRRLTADLPDDAAAYAAVMRTLAGQTDPGASLSVGGDLPPASEQRAHFADCAVLASELVVQIQGAAGRRLQAEQQLMRAPPSEAERQAADLQGMGEQMMASVLEAEPRARKPTPVEVWRASRSLDELRAAMALLELAAADVSPVSSRAVVRGDRVHEISADDGLLLDVRVQGAKSATAYYDLGGATEKHERALDARRQLEIQLADLNATRKQQLEAKRPELEAAAEDARRAAAEMQKTEAEKQAFKDEADALEEELGF